MAVLAFVPVSAWAQNANLQVTVDDGRSTYTPGAPLTYTIEVTNLGPDIAAGAMVVDNVTAQPQVTGASWTCVGAGGGTCTAGPVADGINDVITLPVNGTATYTLTVATASSATGDLAYKVGTVAPAGTTDPDLLNDSAVDVNASAPVADLEITKDNGVADYTPGGDVTYTIVVSNHGPSDVTGATVTDALTSLPQVTGASWTCVAANGASCTAGPTAGDLNDSVDLPVGGTATYSLIASIDAAATGDLVNVASVTPPAGTTDPGPVNDTAGDTDVAGTPVADLRVNVDDGGGTTYTPGVPLIYTIVVRNAGPNGVAGAAVTDLVTSLPQVSAASWTCVGGDGGNCTAGPVAGDINDSVTLPLDGTATYTVNVSTASSATGDLVHAVSVAPPGGTNDPDPLNDNSEDTNTSAPVADLEITKDDGVADYTPGGSVTYTIVVSNSGPSDVSGAAVTDPVMALPQVSGASWSCVSANGASCTSGPLAGDLIDSADLPVGGTATYSLVTSIDAAASGDLVNTAKVAPPPGTTDSGASSNTAVDTDTAGAATADLSIVTSADAATYTPGGQVTYTIVVSNAGPSAVTGATVTSSMTGLPQVTGAGWSCVAAGGASCTAGPTAGDLNDSVDLPVGGTATYTFVVDIAPGATGALNHLVGVTPPAGVSDPNPGNETAADTSAEGAPVADLEISVDDGAGSYTPGLPVTYTIVVTNHGPSDVTNAVVTDAVNGLPQVSGSTWTCVAGGGASCSPGPATGDLNDTVNLPVDGTLTYTLIATTDPAATGDLVNTVGVTPPAGTGDPIPANDGDSDSDTASPVTDLSITKDDGVGGYVPGGALTYTLVVTNSGPSDVTGAGVSDPVTALPQVSGATWSCVGAGGASCTSGPVAGDIADLVDLPVGGSATYTLDVNVAAAANGDLINVASVSPPAGGSDPVPGNDSASDTDGRMAVADLGITITDGVTSYTPGGVLAYTIVVGNVGPSDVFGATVTDAITALPQVAGASWSCAAAGGANCAVGPVAGDLSDSADLPVGGTATYTVTVNLNPAAGGQLVNTASVTTPAGTTDPDGLNNTATDTDNAGSLVSDLSITKDDGRLTYTPGSSFPYTITIHNAGPSSVTGVSVEDEVTTLPQVTGANWTCVGAGGATCTAGPVVGDVNDTADVPAGGTLTYTLTVTLDPSASGDLVNTATVSSGLAADPNASNDSATDTDTEGPRVADLAITKDDGQGSYTPGSPVTYTVVVTNNGPSDIVGATVTDALTALAQVASASWSCVAAGGASCTAGPVAGDVNDSVSVPVGDSVTYTIVASLDPAATGDLANTASVVPPAGVTDPVPANDSATDTDSQGGPIADLQIVKDNGVGSYTPGVAVVYTIVVTNAGPSSVTGATVNDTITAVPQVQSASWTCAGAGGASCTAGPVAGDINDTADLPVGGTATYTLTVNIDPIASGSLVNSATVTEPGGTTDPDPGNNSDTDTDSVSVVADLGITLTDGTATYTPGLSTVYTIDVTNQGPSAVIGASVTDAITALPQVASASWTCSGTGGTICTAGPVVGDISDSITIPVGETATYTLNVTLRSDATGDLVNSAAVAIPGGSTDPVGGNDSASDTDTVLPVSNLSLNKDDGVPFYAPGGWTVYTIVVQNAGPSDSVGASVTDAVTALPQVSGASWTCTAAGGASCSAGPIAGDINDLVNLPVGGTVTYTLDTTFGAGASSPVINTAMVTVPAGSTDPTLGDNHDNDVNPEAPARSLSGRVVEDVGADASLSGDPGRPGVRVALYRDDGDNVPENSDLLLRTVNSDGSGAYEFILIPDTYWLVIDSQSFSPSDGFNGGSSTSDVWAEQTHGGPGTWCDDGSGGSLERGSAGPCIGGKDAGVSDTNPTPAAGEHLARVDLNSDRVVDFGFSYSAVVNARDGDDIGGDLTIQGSLRQFILNATALNGAQTGTFRIPTGYATTIFPVSELPHLDDANTTIDGTTQSGYSGRPIVELDGSSAGDADGLEITAAGCTIRGLAIHGFDKDGIRINGPGDNRIEANFIGTDTSGTNALGISNHGIHVGSANNVVGGTDAATRNIISGCGKEAISISGGKDGNVILGNYIGTDVTGNVEFGNGAEGIKIKSDGNTIGGTAAGAGNIIAGSGTVGIRLEGAHNNTIFGNSIGTDLSGSRDFGSGSHGVLVEDGNDNRIGGIAAGEENRIAFNRSDGVSVTGGSDSNTISGNRIYDNGDLGIDLDDDGATANDPGDGDGGPNGLQNAPILSTVVHGTASTEFIGSLNSTPNSVFRVEYFYNTTADSSGFGEGEFPLGFHSVTTDAAGNASWNVTRPSVVPSGRPVSATATNASGATSEFGPRRLVTSRADLSLGKSVNEAAPNVGSTVIFTVTVSNAGPSDATGVVVRDLLPSGYAYVGDDVGGAYDDVSGDWTVATLGVGASAVLNITASVNPSGDYTNRSEVLALDQVDPDSIPGNGPDQGEDDEAEAATTPVPVADVSVTKDDGTAQYTPGGTVSYTIVVTNAGPSDATGVTVADAVVGLPFVTGASWTCIGAGGGTCTAGPVAGDVADTVDLPAGASATYTLDLTLDPVITGNLVNTVTASVPAGTIDPAGANDTATDTDTSGPPIADLEITKDDGVVGYTAGGSVTYTVVAANSGPSHIVGATVRDLVTALPQVEGASWSCVPAGGATCTAGPVAGDVNDTVDLPVGGTLTYTVLTDLRSSASGDLVNTSEIVPPAGASDPDGTDNSATDTDTMGPPQADVSITKDDGVTSYAPGETLDYTIVVGNAGPGDVQAATVVDLVTALPQVTGASWTCVAAGGASCTAGPVVGDLNDTVAIPVGGTATYTLSATLDPAAAGTIVNSATVALPAGGTDPDTSNNSAQDSDGEGPRVADLQITKSDGSAGYTPGTTNTYTIVVTNAGPSSVSGVGVSDAVTALPSFTGATWTCVPAGGATCTAGPVVGDIADTIDLPAGATATYTLLATTDSGATGNLVNTATVVPPAAAVDPNGGNNSATDTDTEGPPIADLRITKDDGAAVYTPGSSVTYTIVVSNAGPSAVFAASVSDSVVALPQVTGASWSCVASPGSNCNPGPVSGDLNDAVDLPVGGTATYTLVADLNPSAAGDLVNTASVALPAGGTDPDATNNDATDLDTEGPRVADLQITNDDGVTEYTPGGVLTYTIVATNAGPSDVSNASVSNPITGLPQVAGASWSCVASGGATCAAGPVAGDLNDTIDLPRGGSATYTLTANLDPAATAILAATATVTAPAFAADSNVLNNSATDTDVEGAPVADLGITKDDGVAGYTPGTTVTYTIVVTNAGPSFVYGATVTDAVTSLPQVTDANWTCAPGAGAACTAGPVAGDLNDTVDVPPGGSVTYTLTADLDPAATGNLVNSADVAMPVGATDPNSANDSASDTDVEGPPVADLVIVKDDGQPQYTPGLTATYTIVVTNAGPSSILGAAVTDAVVGLPQVTGASWTCVAASGASCTAGPVSGNLADTPNIPVGGSATYTLVADLDPAATGDLVNTATVAPPAAASDPQAGNDSATDTDTQGPPAADLGITLDDGRSTYTPGTSLSYTIEVTNTGPSAVTGATVTSAIEALAQVTGVSWTCLSASGASCTAGPLTGDINDTVNIPVSGSLTYSLTATVDPAATGDLAAAVTVSPPAGTGDPEPANDSATDTDTQAPPEADLSLTMSVDNAAPIVNDNVIFTVQLTNAGPSTATGITVANLLPAGYAYVGDDAGGGYDSASGQWTVGTLDPSLTSVLNVTARVLALGDHINRAEVMAATSQDPDSTPGNGMGNGEDDEAQQATSPSGTDAVVDITDSALPGDTMALAVTDPDMNADLGGPDTLQTVVTNDATGETESIALMETGPGTGTFQGNLPTTFGTSAGPNDDGTIAAQAGDTLTLRYLDVVRAAPGSATLTDQAAILGGVDATVYITPNSSPGDLLTVRVSDADMNADSASVESVQVTVVNNVTGESETLTLQETGIASGVFEATLPTVFGSGAGTDDDGTMTTTVGQSLAASYFDALTAAGNSATVTATGLVSALDAVRLIKAAALRETTTGSAVPYSIVATNNTVGLLNGILISDSIPVGFKYVPDSARLVRAGANGQLGDADDVVTKIDPAGPRPLEFSPVDLAVGETVELQYVLRVGSGALPGEHANRATPFLGGFAIGETARATIEVVSDVFFDQATIIGKVFEDTNRNELQDQGERGVGNVMVALDDGTYALTDEHGRFHFPALEPGNRLVKLNAWSLPPGSAVVGEKSRILRITPGIMAKANFGVVTRTEQVSIGRPEERGVDVAGGIEHQPTQVLGKTEELSLLINDRLVELAATDVRLGVKDVSSVAMIKGGRFEQPLNFHLNVEQADTVHRWEMRVLDSSDREVRTFRGDGEPPREIEWDGRAKAGLIEPGKIYQFQLSVEFDDGTISNSKRQLFGVGRTSVISLDLAGGAFAVDGTELSDDARKVLDEVGQTLAKYPEERLVIEGHTDDRGTDEYNLDLSRRRAEAAAVHLAANWGLDRERLILAGRGEREPVATNDLEEGRTVNRRVELRAEFEDVVSEEIIDQHRTQPVARINGETMELGNYGRFAAQVPSDGVDELKVEVQGSQGRSVQTVIPLPRLEIHAPTGGTTVGEGHPRNGCSISAAGVACELRGRTDPGATLSLNGREILAGADGTFSSNLSLEVGENVFGVLARNEEGYSRSANLLVRLNDRDADGRMLIVTEAIPNLTVNLPPLETKSYNTKLPLDGTTDPGNKVFVNDVEIEVDAAGRFETVVDLPSGKSRLVVRVEDQDGHSGTIERDVQVAKTQLFMMAFGEAEFHNLEATGAIQDVEERDDYYTEGRLAFYLKGVVAGKYLMTAAFDSGREKLEDLFTDLNGDETDRLLTNLDPDKYYPVYGDSSTLVWDVQSQGKFYLALDSEQIHVLIGNYPLSLNDTELAAYRRTLYGGRFVYQSASKTETGRSNTEVVLFGADASNTHVTDQLRATGGSLYYLSQREIIEGSEEVTLIVRDRRTGLLLSQTRQRRNADYLIKYPEGRLMFQRNILSVVQDITLINQAPLAGNPVFIQVDYEVPAQAFDKVTAGARVRRQIGDKVSVGGTYISDENDSGDYQLGALDTEIRPDKHTRLLAEYADSRGTDSVIYVSTDGGLSYSESAATGMQEGAAWKVAAELDVGGWFGKSDRYQIKLFHKELQSGFYSSGNSLEQGTTKSGLYADLELTERDSLLVRYDLEDRDAATAGPFSTTKRTTGSALWSHKRERWVLSGELFNRAVTGASEPFLGDATLAAVRFWKQLNKRLSGRVEYQHTLSGETNNQTTLGIEYEVMSKLALQAQGTVGTLSTSALAGAVATFGESEIYVQERIISDSSGESNATVVGARSPIGEATRIYTEYQVEGSAQGDKAISLVGLQRQWDPTPGVKLLLSAENSSIEADAGDARRNSIAAGVTWAVPDRFTLSSRNEFRRESGVASLNQFYTSTKFDYQLNDSLALMAKFRYSRSEDASSGATEALIDERGIGLAYRPVRNDRFNALGRYTRLQDLRPIFGGALESFERTLDVVSLETIFDITPRLEWVTKTAARLQEENTAVLDSFESQTLLGVQRLNVTTWRRLVIGVEFRALMEREADDHRDGFLGEAMWKLHEHFRIGGGYNFTEFSDNEFSENDYSLRGWFMRIQGRY
jgi:uncharacterized repeat protein (TIGR01451 family)